ncbi:Clavaminate synthase-like protein [Delitschia confertaspora ATCC 74209]|uniref:Clavaminate synthase-like protein n=1 Tax=Delitschia confertaspora ATCC 74209 TaxID=1513339 RepID=A0A9P4JDV7_9PLEO|nr:Clavaminate synthase-like protein [Delitschia confertaspora ATCC 74209]
MRYVSRNRPFVIRKGAEEWKARKMWNAKYLEQVMGNQLVNVAMTPLGNADSVVEVEDRDLLFVKPYETEEPFETVLRKIQEQELNLNTAKEPTRYAQTQNDNLRNEYVSLFADCPTTIPFARITLEQDPDAINFWLGNSHSTTALHKDNYENIYVQILGQKHFVLLPPVESACVNEKRVVSATYVPQRSAGDQVSMDCKNDVEEELRAEDLVISIDVPEERVPFATWDPDDLQNNSTRFSKLSRPLRVTLGEGDMLYLPALWYHKVSQSCSPEGICCAVNYWYDLDFAGSFWPLCSFSRSVGLLASGKGSIGEEQSQNDVGDEV